MKMTETSSNSSGGCQCGEITFAFKGRSLRAYCCHCTECRKQSGSAFGTSIIVKTSVLQVTSGIPNCWSRTTSNGAELKCYFCKTCGTRLWHWADDDPEHVSIKGGTLDSPPAFDALDHIWTSSMLEGVKIPGHAKVWEKDPV